MRKFNPRRDRRAAAGPAPRKRAIDTSGAGAHAAADQAAAKAAALHAAGRYNEAINAYYAALTLHGDHAPALHGLGVACFQLGRRADARELVRRAVALAPGNAEYHNNLGTILAAGRQLEEAMVCHHRALTLAPDFPEAHNNLGNALREFGRFDEALACFDRALALRPGYAEAALNRGNVLRDRRDPIAAVAAYRLAVSLNPGLADAHNNLGTALKELGQWPEALAAYESALALAPDAARIHYNLGTARYQVGQLDGARRSLEEALMRQPAFPEALLNLGNIAKDQGRLADAQALYRAALTQRPDFTGAHSNLLFTLNYMDGVSQQAIFEAHCEFASRQAPPPDPVRPANLRDPERRLRIAYVSPDLRAHAVAVFLEPLLRHHDRKVCEVFAYAEVAQPDAVTARLRTLADGWRSTVGLNDAALADLIRGDGIDIVIDLAGHTANNRLLTLARKPAPVQVSYLGYPATTGLPAFDYRLTDAVTEPPGTAERFYTERLVRLPNSLWCYQPADDMPAVTPLPALARGHVTFGSFNNFAKVGPRVLALWARVLAAVPGSRLALLCASDEETQAQVAAQFAAHGIARERLVLYGREVRAAYLQRFAQADIALDPFPCNGGTTTCDALWMGLPVVSLIGETFLSRASYSVLCASGCEAFAQASEDDYVACCVDLARNPSRLATLRATLRDRLQGTPLLDGPLLAANIECALREMWRRWCAEAPA